MASLRSRLTPGPHYPRRSPGERRCAAPPRRRAARRPGCCALRRLAAVAGPLEHLLERGAVGPAHGAREHAGEERDALTRRVGAPLSRVGAAVAALAVGARRVERGPQRIPACRELAAAAVAERVRAAHVLAEQR